MVCPKCQSSNVNVQAITYATGDEFYHWLHDEDGFTIVQNHQTGYFCYATLGGEELLASAYVVGDISPSSVGLSPRINISSRKMGEIRDRIQGLEKAYTLKKTGRFVERKAINTKGVINNVVIYIRFSDEEEFTDMQSTYSEMFNSTTAGTLSQHNYFNEVSYGTLNMDSKFLPVNSSSTVISYKDSHPRSYYMVYNVTSNPQGYVGDAGRTEREHTLLQSAVTAVTGQLPLGTSIDADGDGNVDNVIFIVKGSSIGWSDLLWPHKWSLYSKNATINGKTVDVYNFQLQNDLGVSVLCHEMFHTLGAPDLYHYTDGTPDPVGPWDLMNQNLSIPQHMTQYMKLRYGKWIDNIPEITASGDYALNPVFTKDNSCYKIRSPFSSTEYFVIEYRKREKTDIGLPSEGLLVYRINTEADGLGNRNGPPDELYVYRPGGSLESNGNLSAAVLSAAPGNSAINDKTNPDAYLSNGGIGGLSISNVSAAGATISFHVDIATPTPIDVAVTKLVSPVSSFSLSAAEKIKVMVSGLGTTTISSGVKVNYQINGGSVVSEDFVGNLAYGASVPFEFTTPADLSNPETYKLKVYTTLVEDLNSANDTISSTIINEAPLEYLAAMTVTAAGTYTDLTAGSLIAVDAPKDGLSAPTTFPDGFEFKYCGKSFTQFILSTNGFIKLGDQSPSSKSLFFATSQTADGGVFNSVESADNTILAPFNQNLIPGDGGAEYRMEISGTIPNRVVTIQFKNVSDNVVSQYSSINFQIRLYEGSSIIEFVYGPWTASANASAFKTSLCGLRGLGNLPSQLLAVNKASGQAWSELSFANGNYSTTATLNYGNPNDGTRPAPEVGRLIRFTPQQSNDLAVTEIYTMGQLPLNFGAPHVISAAVSNFGTAPQTGVVVTLNVTGANVFTPAVVVIPSINPGENIIVTFTDFVPSALGANSLTVSLPDDQYTLNNTKVSDQIITSSTYSYADPATTAESGYKGSFAAVCKYHINGSAKITSVDAMILNNTSLSGKTTKAYVYNKSGGLVGQSNSFAISANQLGKWVSFAITIPPSITNADYYVGLDCSNSYFAAYQAEYPTRTDSYFQIPLAGGTPIEFGNNARLMFRANVSAITGIDPTVLDAVRIYSDTKNVFVAIPEINGAAQLSVYDILGNKVYQRDNLSLGLNMIEHNFASGTYIVRLLIENEVISQKVVIMQ